MQELAREVEVIRANQPQKPGQVIFDINGTFWPEIDEATSTAESLAEEIYNRTAVLNAEAAKICLANEVEAEPAAILL